MKKSVKIEKGDFKAKCPCAYCGDNKPGQKLHIYWYGGRLKFDIKGKHKDMLLDPDQIRKLAQFLLQEVKDFN